MRGLILDRGAELGLISSMLTRAETGRGSLVLVEGPTGIGKTTLLAAGSSAADSRVLQARGLALEGGFPFGVVRQLFEPVRVACTPEEWDELTGGAARPARRVFDGSALDGSALDGSVFDGGAFDGGSAGEAGPHATTHGLYWLAANLAARQPLVIAADDLQWADALSLRWLSHMAARIEDLPVTLLLAARSGPDQPDLIAELRAFPYCARLTLRPLSEEAVSALLREYLGDGASRELAAVCWERTGGNPFLLESLLESLVSQAERERGVPAPGVPAPGVPAPGVPAPGVPASRVPVMAGDVRAAGPEPVAEVTLRRVAQLGAGAEALTRAVAVLGVPVPGGGPVPGGPVPGGAAPLRQTAALADQDVPRAARLADSLRAAGVLAPGETVEFAHPIVGTAVYESIPPGERAIAHARAARLLEADGADSEGVALHLLRSLPAGDPHVVGALLAAARDATGRGATDTAAGYLRRALDEPPSAEARGEVLLELGLALASVRNPAAIGVLRNAVGHTLTVAVRSGAAPEVSPEKAVDAALASAGALGLWGHHDIAREVCRETLNALRAAGTLGQAAEYRLTAGLLAQSWLSPGTAASAWASWSEARSRRGAGAGAGTGAGDDNGAWRVYDALSATITGEGHAAVMAHLGPVLDDDLASVESSPPAISMGLLVLNWNDEFETALRIGDRLLAAARERGSMNMVADVCRQRSGTLRRLGKLQEAADDARYAFDFELATSPPLAVAWSATHLIEALDRLGQLDEADAVAEQVAARRPPEGWFPTTTYLQARGLLRVTQRRFGEGLDDLLRAGEAWRALGVTNPSVAWWRSPAVRAYRGLGREEEGAALAAEYVELARRAGTKVVLGCALLVGARFSSRPVEDLREAVRALEEANARYDMARALAELGAHLRRAGRRADAQRQLRRALDVAEHSGGMPLSAYAREELHAAGGRPRRTAQTGPDALTPAEHQVATLAAEGMSNRQIAQHLFITQATVESHLRHAFHKLGINSRTALPACLPPPHSAVPLPRPPAPAPAPAPAPDPRRPASPNTQSDMP